jgi:transcriptional regulator with XRE-family HTH domain
MVSGRHPDLERRRLVIEWRAQGLTLKEIGRRLGITRQAVHTFLKGVGKVRGRAAVCCVCREPLERAGVLPRDVGTTLCLVCLARQPKATFGQRLKAFRLTVGLTRRELDRVADLSPGSTQSYEQDRRFPHPGTRAKLAKALGVTVEVLGASPPLEEKRGRPRKNVTV